MKQSRLLLYALVLIFIAGVILICMVEKSSAWSRIATGLITGAFVGAVNTLVNYFHQRKEFFSKYSMATFELSQAIIEDFIHFKTRLDFIQTATRDEIINRDYQEKEQHMEEARKFNEKYRTFGLRLESDAYAPLIFLQKKRLKLMAEMEDIIWKIQFSSGQLQTSYAFGMLAVKVDKEEQLLAIGNPDEFYESTMQDNLCFRDLLVTCISELSNLCKMLCDNINGIVGKKYIKTLDFAAGALAFAINDKEEQIGR